MTTFHFQTHVPSSGMLTLPQLPETFRGENVTVKIDRNSKPKREISLDEICGDWDDDQLRTSNESFEEFCARYDQIGVSTKGWTFDREELYGDRLTIWNPFSLD